MKWGKKMNLPTLCLRAAYAELFFLAENGVPLIQVCVSGANLDTKTEIVMVWRNGTFFAFSNALLYRDNS